MLQLWMPSGNGMKTKDFVTRNVYLLVSRNQFYRSSKVSILIRQHIIKPRIFTTIWLSNI